MGKQHLWSKLSTKISGQSVIEYFVILTVILAVILSTGLIERMRAAFDIYFTTAVRQIVP